MTEQIGSVAFIGAGAMAEAMLAGMLARGVVQPEQITASHPRAGRRDELHARYGVTLVEENREAARGADLVVLTVKPQVVRGVLADLRDVLTPEQVVLSIAAGVPLTVIVNGLGGHGAAARAMPNTPAQIGEGVSVWATTASVTDDAARDDRHRARRARPRTLSSRTRSSSIWRRRSPAPARPTSSSSWRR